MMDGMGILSSKNPLNILVKYGVMGWNNTCGVKNCSGHGECHNGTCLCEIQFEGLDCRIPNLSYYTAFSTVFFILAFISFIQLIMCIVAEWQRMKTQSFFKACRITTQKLLYFVIFLASIIRGAYFTAPAEFKEGWSRSLLSAYYPLLLSGSSLIVCFWAEVFHLKDIKLDKPQFLSKSFLAFVVFNFLIYSLLFVELIITQMNTINPGFYAHVFNGCYAVLLSIVVVFFLIYGIEVFFKIRGGFLSDYEDSFKNLGCDPLLSEQKTINVVNERSNTLPMRQINLSQLHQSRLGLLSQAIMLFIVIGFLLSETFSEFWKTEVPLTSRNWHNIVFHIIEAGVALWFPCVLWNCMSPEQLWILNPKRIIKGLELERKQPIKDVHLEEPGNSKVSDETKKNAECWICYDNEKYDLDSFIHPCQCRGDVSAVHHDCLRRWLVESMGNANNLKCQVCNTPYNVEHSDRFNWQNGLTSQHCVQVTITVLAICASVGIGCFLIQRAEEPIIKVIIAGTALIIIYICMRFLSMNTAVLYERAKISSLNIMSTYNNEIKRVTTISRNVSTDSKNSDPILI